MLCFLPLYLDLSEEGLNILLLRVQEPVRCVIRRRVGQKIDSRQAGLFAAGHKNDDRLARRVLGYRVVGRLGHRDDTRRVVRHVEALDVELKRDGPDVGVEVKGGVGAGAQPLRDVLAVAQRRRQG